jgi:hypothetical protein
MLSFSVIDFKVIVACRGRDANSTFFPTLLRRRFGSAADRPRRRNSRSGEGGNHNVSLTCALLSSYHAVSWRKRAG